MQMRINYPEESAEQVSRFLDAYGDPRMFTPSPNQSPLTPKPERTCRFCSRTGSEAPFKTDAHIFPEFLGRNSRISDFECDDCNQFFSRYESDLAAMLQIDLAFHQVRGKKKIPKFKSREKTGESVTVQKIKLFNKEFTEIAQPDGGDFIKLDHKTGSLSVTFTRAPFVPNNAYKSLIKFGLSLMNNLEARNYKLTSKYLLGVKQFEITGCPVNGHIFPMGSIQFNPFALLYTKRDQKAKIFTHVVALYFLNFIYSFPIPLNSTDLLHGLENLKMIPYPPIHMSQENLTPQPIFEDLSSQELLRNAKYQLTGVLNFGESDRIGIDLNTGKKLDPNVAPSDTVKLLFAFDDTPLEIPGSDGS